MLLIFLATAALDAGRFGWSAMPTIVRAIGTAALVAAVGVIWWCAVANHFLSARSGSRANVGIQSYSMVPIVSSGIRCTRRVLSSVALTRSYLYRVRLSYLLELTEGIPTRYVRLDFSEPQPARKRF